MKVNLKISNFGKVKNANITLSPFTMIVGPNGCGKSFITKALYSIFHTMNQDLFANFIIKNLNIAIYSVNEIHNNLIKPSESDRITIEKLIEQLISLRDSLTCKFENVTILQIQDVICFIDDEIAVFDNTLQEFILSLKGKKTKKKSIELYLDSLKYNILRFKDASKDFLKFYSSEFSSSLKNEFVNNFLVQSIGELQLDNYDAKFDFEDSNIGNITLSKNDIFFQINQKGMADVQKLSNVVYLESPIYFKLRKTLNESRFLSSPFRRKGVINQVPKYFYDVDQLLTSKILSDDSVSFLAILDLIETTVNGKFDITSQGEIVFMENSQMIPFNMVSSGMSNLGIIYLLIKKNVLTKGSYLIIDEPEINLHTEWQHIMLDILFELSKQGVIVVVASHSLDMVYRLENVVTKNNHLCKENHFSINRINKDGFSEEKNDILTDILKAKQDLSRPYIKLYDSRLP